MMSLVRSELLRSDPGELDQRFDVVYAQSHPLVEEERAWHRDYADSFLDGEGGPGADAGQSQEGQRA